MAEELALKVKLDTSDLEKSMKKISVGAGAPAAGAGGGGLGGLGGAGLAKAGAIAGVVAAGSMAIIGALKKGFDMMREISPQFDATIKIMTQSLGLMLRPIGDILAFALRPFALMMIKYAANFYKNWRNMKDWFTFENVEQMFEQLGLSGVFDMLVEIAEFLKVMFEVFIANLKILWAIIRPVGELLIWLVSKALEPLMPLIKFWVDLLGISAEVLGMFADALLTLTEDWDWGAFTENLAEIGQVLWDGIKKAVIELEKNVKEFSQPIWDFFAGIVKGIWESIKQAWEGLIETIKGFFSAIFKGMINSIISILNSAIDTINLLPGVDLPNIKHVQDAIVKPDGQVIQTDPMDYIIATRDPQKMLEGRGGGMSYSPQITINANVASNVDVQQLASQIIEYSKQELTRRTGDFRL